MKERNLTRVAAVVPWPETHSPHSHSASETVTLEAVGDVILGIGSPTGPSPEWTCGTDVVWPVYEMNGKTIELDRGLRPYVCRHQIIAGD